MFDLRATRRAMLRRAAATAGAGALLGTAGCSSLSGLFGDDGVQYTEWMPAPGQDGAGGRFDFAYYDLTALASEASTLGGEPDVFEETWAPLSLVWEDATAVVTVGLVDVVTASFDRFTAASTLEGEGYTEVGTHRGYTIYETEGRAFGLTDGTIVVSGDSQFDGAGEPADRIRAVVDAKTGGTDRYYEESEGLQALVDELGAATLVTGTLPDEATATNESGRFENLRAEGSATTLSGGTASEKWVFVYERPRDVDIGALRAYVEANDNTTGGSSAPFDSVEELSYEQRGKKGVITGTRDAGWYFDG